MSEAARLQGLVESAASPIHGTGCFARVAIEAGTFIGTFTGPRAGVDGPHVLWADDGERWIGRRGTSVLRYLNHSDVPNAAFEGFDLFATAPIAAGQEITINYQP
jgi:hypothetical protein